MAICAIEDCPTPARKRGWCEKHYIRWSKYGDPNIVLKAHTKALEPNRTGKCTVHDCGRSSRNGTSLYCEMHYSRWKRHGDPNVALKDHTPAIERWKTSYEVDGQTGCWIWTGPNDGTYGFIQDGVKVRDAAHRFVYKQVNGSMPKNSELFRNCLNTLCVNPHHMEIRVRRTVRRGPVDHTPAVERWKYSYQVDETGCWLWTGQIRKDGYGIISNGRGTRIRAHRFVWEQVKGTIPEGEELDHLCHTRDVLCPGRSGGSCQHRRCVNPEHLEAVSHLENTQRIIRDSGWRLCRQGHKLTPASIYINPATGWVKCLACARARQRKKKYRYAYIYLHQPNHPLADKSGKVLEHRMVLYDAIGPGPHACHWKCGRVVSWGGIKGIHVDHVNGDPSDNLRVNLVPSCQSCNKSRAASGNLVDWCPPVGRLVECQTQP